MHRITLNTNTRNEMHKNTLQTKTKNRHANTKRTVKCQDGTKKFFVTLCVDQWKGAPKTIESNCTFGQQVAFLNFSEQKLSGPPESQ